MTANPAPDLVVEGLTVELPRRRQPVRVFRDLSFRVAPGSLLLLLGPSGCGKTTLLSCLAGLRHPTSGAIRFGGVAVEGLEGHDLDAYRRRVGIIFQAFNLVESLTAAENVAVPLRGAGWRRGDARRRAASLLESVGLGDCLDRRPGLLSGGEQQRVAVARALALDPPLVLADEPTAHLDQHNVEGALRLLRRLADDGRTVVVSTHDERLVPLADQTLELAPRRVADDADPAHPSFVELAPGEVLFRQGDPADWVYMVVSGVVELVQDGALVSTAAAGDWFGEMGPLFSLPRSATARAGVTTTVLEPVTTRELRGRLGVATLRGLVARRGADEPA